jgi:hypothetical protein
MCWRSQERHGQREASGGATPGSWKGWNSGLKILNDRPVSSSLRADKPIFAADFRRWALIRNNGDLPQSALRNAKEIKRDCQNRAIAKIAVIAKIEKQKLMADGMRSSTSDGLCTPKWADCKAEKQLIPWGLRVVPGISQVFENGIVSAYVSQLAQSK